MKNLQCLDMASMTLKLGFVSVLLMSAGLIPSAYGVQSLTLTWDPSSGADVTGYNIYYGQVGGGFTNAIDVGGALTNTISGLQEAVTYFFFVSAYNSARIESDPSNVVNYSVPGTGTNTPPTISNIADQTTFQNIATAPIAFTVGDTQTPVAGLVVTSASSNPSLVPVSNIVLAGSGANRTVIITPALNQMGTATITLTVNDGSITTSDSLVLTVNPFINTPPTISSITDRSINEDSNTGTIAITIGDAHTTTGNLTLSGASSNPTLVPASNIGFGGSGASRTVTVTPAANQSGMATVTITVSDGLLSASGTFVLTVNPVNDAPTISTLADQTINQGTSTGPIGLTIGDIETTAGSLVVSGSSSNPTLVPNGNLVFGGSGASRTVTVTPATDQTGTASITVTVNDGSAITTDSFVLTVNPAGTFTRVFLPFEAESGSIVSPMAVASDPSASGGRFIVSSTDDSGSATFAVDVPAAGEYVVWCRVLSPDNSTDSFYVSVDGGTEDIYETAGGAWTNTWQWTAVSGRNGGVNPRTFQISAGRHNLVFRGREQGTALDQILVTNDRSFVPGVNFTITTPNASISSITVNPPGSVTLTWPAVAGNSYRVVYKTRLSDPTWAVLSPDVISTGATASRTDYVAGNRFYGLIQLP
jgi:hypothetical protein